ncbi:MAG: hypothetical protein KKA62_01325 [Nanoarchaeota archaeon]|nr:hypothetical protein [Nanoarchaeota archaeon]MBU1976574.1 hypothetical protein [Nanoarchaeota archaeon]
MVKKRGMLVVVLVVLILSSLSVLGTWNPDPTKCDQSRCVSIWKGTDGNTKGSCDKEDVWCGALNLGQVYTIHEVDECKIEGPFTQPDKGCWVIVGDEDDIDPGEVTACLVLGPGLSQPCIAGLKANGADADDCAGSQADPGEIFGSGGKGIFPKNIKYFGPDLGYGDTTSSNDIFDLISSMSYNSNFEYICSDDKYWHPCENELQADNSTTWADNELFMCTSNEDTSKFYWESKGKDEDHDGYTTTDGDCADNPLTPGLKDPAECPSIKLSDSEWSGLSLEAVREKVKGICSYPQDSRCAVCINKGAPEVCGDDLNNDCQGDEEEFLPDQLNNKEGWTNDDCNKNEEACTQGFGSQSAADLIGGNEGQEGKCTVDLEECTENCQTCQDDSDCSPDMTEDCVFPKPKSLGDESLTGATNIYGAHFSWIQTKENSNEGYCCGFRGVEDLGVIQKQVTSKGGGEFACLTTDEELVGMEGFWDSLVPGESRCGDDWCWVNSIGNAKFKILTVKKPGQTPFDIVSNNGVWNVCNGMILDTLADPTATAETDINELNKLSNRFYCYDEGNHWAFAECAGEFDDRENKAIKGRFAGEGLFALPLKIGDEKVFDISRIGEEVDVHASYYKEFYGRNYFLDFSKEDYLNFMVKFVDEEGNPLETDKIALPAGIELTIFGPKDANGINTILYKNEVLGYVVNSPLFNKDTYMHIKVPLTGEYKAVDHILLKSKNEKNLLEARNVYLSRDDENHLCSGDDATAESSWLTDMDTSGVDKQITGEELCTILYGDNAWLGRYDDEVTYPSASCCGNNLKEYYSESSKKVVTETQEDPEGPIKAKEDQYACWNSQAVASGETIMNVEFNVKSNESKYEVSYDALKVPSIGSFTYETVPEDKNEKPVIKSFTCGKSSETLEVGVLSKQLCNFTLKDLPGINYSGTKVKFTAPESEVVGIEFYDLINYESQENYLSPSEVKDFWYHPMAVVLYLLPGKYHTAEQDSSQAEIPTSVSYSCNQDECLFPLPGNPPYKITNSHPELYELYFVTSSLKKDETLITTTDKIFEVFGNIKARKVAQQVLFYAGDDEKDINSGFYGCNSAKFLDIFNVINKPYCSVIGTNFCAYSVEQEAKQEKFTTISSWSDEEITKVGYEDIQNPEDENVSNYYETIELQLKDKSFPPEERNHSATVLPARNFISNAEFATLAADIPHWEIRDAQGKFVPSEKAKIVGKTKVVLNSNEKLTSERIAVKSGVDLYFSQENNCMPTITLVDKDGNKQLAALPQFDTGTATFLTLEFKGSCEIEKPMLQLVDEDGPIEYSYKTQPDTENFDARKGAACCPDKYCWNGYACVEPMGTTSLAEHIGEGRDYRCIDGEWKSSPLRWDWNSDKWGFCELKSQCFVLSSEFASKENTAQTFYQGKYPDCINNTEYVFDHYCDSGEWTSRTKYLATKLIEVAENDDFVLYCSPYRDTLPDYENKEGYIGGDISKVEEEKKSLGETIKGPSEPEILSTCFSALNDPEGKRLVQDKDNTCVNNVCVLNYKESGKIKTAFATTLNRPLDSEKSFLISLDIPQTKTGQLCSPQKGNFVECDLSGLNFADNAKLLYSGDLNALIFAKEGININPSVIDKILNWFSNLFGLESKLSKEKAFVTDAQNFKDLYLLKTGDKQIRAVKEIFPGVKQALVAEYENFDTSVCKYVENINVPPELELELLEKLSEMEKLTCNIDGKVQKVEMVAGLDFFWPQLTGKLRVS